MSRKPSQRPLHPLALLPVLLALCLLRASGLELRGNSPRIKRNVLLSCPCSPTGRGYIIEAVQMLNDTYMQDNAQSKGVSPVGPALVQLTDCARRFGFESCINADASLRARNHTGAQLCSYDKRTGRNLQRDRARDSFRLAPRCDARRATSSRPWFRRHGAAPLLGFSEGCVDVALLGGAALQHRRHLWRPVLCRGSLCATPNHALVVRGRWTSMKELCAGEWNCVRTSRWVNNLRLAKNRRWRIDDHVEVTPYDVRFPRVAVWAVQILQEIFHFAAFQRALAVVSGLALSTALKRLFIGRSSRLTSNYCRLW